ncbi:efflux RND transporter periplasmic adaptor subunit [Gillisia sp. M10.2A]|uniref:Efflux RND transporter periplasmic adaptor subunit n=1 Tax=Gillisia lutea TaxID=2909668 RepID=A0ABS9EE40_9FLAO|nr:efflux RND transporter periplasmic adaptor subunit [Gillisia lutea]MCF4101149.1 efflux RND transporter periplasmic adaptor subunit [Gillisia lutea]
MKTIYLFSTFLILFVLGCNSKETTSQEQAGPVVSVKVGSIAQESGGGYFTASGKIEAANSANLSTRMMGFVNDIKVKVGDTVQKGALLVVINNTELSAKKAQVSAGVVEATAAYNNAFKDYQRYTNLFASASATQKELDDVTAQFEMAKARLEAAKQMENEVASQFSYSNIRAPFKGVVTDKFIEKGAMANPGAPLVALESLGNYQVVAMVPENEISQLSTGAKVKIFINSLNTSVAGEIIEISPSSRNTGSQYLVKISLQEEKAELLSGMYASVQFPVEQGTPSAKILIPKSAVVSKGQLEGIYTVSQNNTAVLRWLRLGRSFNDKVEVLAGLSADEPFIISAEGKLYNGATIRIE